MLCSGLSMPAATKPFAIFCGPDDFIANRLGKERFEAAAQEAGADDFSREVISGFANNVDEVETAVNRFRDILLEGGINIKFRQRKGAEIDAACGQLRRSTPPLLSLGK